MRRLLEEAKKLISISSVTADGNEEIANHVGALMRARGLKVQLQQVGHSIEGVSKRQFNVLGVFGDPLVDKKTRKGLLLAAHLDTLPPGLREHWTETAGNPLAALQSEGRIYGLGSADGKLDLLCKLFAMDRFREQKLRMPIYLVASCGEELGMFGAKYLIKSMALNPKYVLVGEATELALVHQQKANVVFKVLIGYSRVPRDARGFNRRVNLSVKGRAAHGANPEEGENAILRLLEFVRLSAQSGFELRLTTLAGGDMVSKVPDRASAELFVTSHQLEDFRRFFTDYCNETGLAESFVAEFGGLGESGVQFLPEAVFHAVCDAVGLFGQFSSELEGAGAEGFVPSHSTVNFGVLSENAGSLELGFDLRLLPSVKPEDVEPALKTAFQQLSGHYPGINLTLVRERLSPALAVAEDNEWLKIARAAAVDCGLGLLSEGRGGASTASEAAVYAQAGFDALAFGPGAALSNAHGPNEFVTLDQLEKAVGFYERIIEKTCLEKTCL